MPAVVTSVVGSIAASARSATCCGVRSDPSGLACASEPCPSATRSAGRSTTRCVAELLSLDQVHRSFPFRITSDSPSVPISASRTREVPSYQTRNVWFPEISEVRLELPAPPADGNCGRPRSAVCTTVPDPCVTRAVCTSTRSWAALRGGSVGSALAWMTEATEAQPMATVAAAAGMAHRAHECREPADSHAMFSTCAHESSDGVSTHSLAGLHKNRLRRQRGGLVRRATLISCDCSWWRTRIGWPARCACRGRAR